jgi:hypothetical protein
MTPNQHLCRRLTAPSSSLDLFDRSSEEVSFTNKGYRDQRSFKRRVPTQNSLEHVEVIELLLAQAVCDFQSSLLPRPNKHVHENADKKRFCTHLTESSEGGGYGEVSSIATWAGENRCKTKISAYGSPSWPDLDLLTAAQRRSIRPAKERVAQCSFSRIGLTWTLADCAKKAPIRADCIP